MPLLAPGAASAFHVFMQEVSSIWRMVLSKSCAMEQTNWIAFASIGAETLQLTPTW